MKKALMVLGFALCGTFAFAQTCNFNATVEKTTLQRSAAPTTIERPVDYKASIFTKTEVELASWEFAASEMSDIVCGTAGCVGANTVIGGETVAAHGQTGAAQMWTRVADSADLYTNSTWGQVASGWKNAIARYMQSYYTGNDNGYMLVVPADAIGTGVHNCFIGFPAVDRGTAQVIDVRFIQSYYNFYDRCFIDYKVGSAWNTREINIDGVDCDINSWGPVRASYTMPLELAQQNNIEIRIRFFADGTHNGSPVSAYGYFWAVDNVKIIAGEPDRWITNSQKFLDGFYGTMPQNMSIPITWYGEAINTGANTRNGIMLNIKHIDNTLQNSTTILSESINSIAPDPTSISYMIADERGFFEGEQDNRPNSGVFEAGNIGGSHLGYWWYGPNYGATSINPNTYGLAGLPVSTTGQQFFAATASSTGADDLAWDTVAYQVVGETGGDGSLSIAGYRWAHDNGIIPSGSLYQFGFTENGQYVTDECPRWNKAQYIVMNRFTTGNTIPTDWVFRGVEIVPQTVDALSDIVGSSVYPMMWEAVWNADSNDWDLVDVATGFSTTIPYTVTMGDLNDLATGRLAPSDDYNAVNLQFYNQPVLKPNTSYYIGYQLAEDGKFGAAKMQYSYLANDGETYIGYYRDQNSEVANGYYQFNPGAYDMYIYDPGRGGYFAGYNSDYCAHIRPIVGPRVALTEYHINATCGNGVEIDDDQFEGICNGYATTYAGASPTIYIIPEGGFCDTCTGAYKIDEHNIMIDGNVVDIDEEYDDFTIAERNYTVYNADSSQTGLRRSYFAVTFINVNGNHSVSANATWNTFQWEDVQGIDPAALNVSLGLQPNPATNSVKLNISGVIGMVNCSIIDMSGRVVYNAKINAEQQQVIDLSNVAAGAYFVRVTNDNFSKVEKLIVR